jgi:hypothetical protein
MNQDNQDEDVKVGAYYLWEKAGRPENRDLEIWLEAENQHASATSAEARKKAPNMGRPGII